MTILSPSANLFSILLRGTVRNISYLLLNVALLLLILSDLKFLNGANSFVQISTIRVSWGLLTPVFLVALALVDSVFLSESLFRKDSGAVLLYYEPLEISSSCTSYSAFIWILRTASILAIRYYLASSIPEKETVDFVVSALFLNCAIGVPLVSVFASLIGGKHLWAAVLVLLLTFVGPGLVRDSAPDLLVGIQGIMSEANIIQIVLFSLFTLLVSLVIFLVWANVRKSRAIFGFMNVEKKSEGNRKTT